MYVLNHAQQNSRGGSTMATLDEHQEAVVSMARKMWEGGYGGQRATVRAETALAGCNTPDSNGFIMFGKYPS